MNLPANDPRRRYVLTVDGKPQPPRPWVSTQEMAKHLVDTGHTVTIRRISEKVTA